MPLPTRLPLFPYTTLFRSKTSPGKGSFTLGPAPLSGLELANVGATIMSDGRWCPPTPIMEIRDRNGKKVPIKEAKDRKSTRLNSSHVKISYAVFCLKKKKN